MSRQGYAADLDDLALLVERVGGCDADLGALLADLSHRVRTLHETWSGRSALAQTDAQAQWERGYAEMRSALDALRTVLGVAHDNYRAAADANVALWSHLAD